MGGQFWDVGLGLNLGVSQFFSVRKSALEPKPYCALIILSMGLGWAKENLGHSVPKYFCLKVAKKEKSTTFGR